MVCNAPECRAVKSSLKVPVEAFALMQQECSAKGERRDLGHYPAELVQKYRDSSSQQEANHGVI